MFNILVSFIGFIILLFAVPELIAQITKVTIRLGPIRYGPIPKIEVGRFVIYLKGLHWYLFLIILIILTILGTWLSVWSIFSFS